MLLTSGIPGEGQVWHLSDLTTAERLRLYGRARVSIPQPLTAGEYTTVRFEFTIGQTPLPGHARLRVAWRWPHDWADLQTHDPEGDGYLSVATHSPTTGRAADTKLESSFTQRGDLNPWMHLIEVRVLDGQLRQGDRVEMIAGETAAGGRGWRAPTCRLSAADFIMLLNPDNSDRWLRLVPPPAYAVGAGPPERLVAIADADGVAGQAVRLTVFAQDRWGNPASCPEPSPQIAPPASTCRVLECSKQTAPPAYHLLLEFDEPGDYQLPVSLPTSALDTITNPIRIHTAQPKLGLFWGDLHSGQTEIGCGAGSLAEHYTFARDISHLQFATHQGNDHYMTRADWAHTRAEATAFHQPGRFVVFLGCEWSPYTEDGGDRNVIYRHDEPVLHRSDRFFTEADPDPTPDLPTAPDFHAAMQEKAILVNLHVGGRPSNLDFHAPALEPLAEIHSTHGTSEWFIEDALRRGYKVGITAGADGVAGRPGADSPGWRLNRNVRSGLTAVYARELTRDGLWKAFQARRCYATTGQRIRLWVEVDGHAMGEEVTLDHTPVIRITVTGTTAIERIDLLRDTQVIGCWQVAMPDSHLWRILWHGTRSQGTAGAQRLRWDGSLRASQGRFEKIRAVGFQSADDIVHLRAPDTLAWRSVTAGNTAGVIFSHAVGNLPNGRKQNTVDDTMFHFGSSICSFAVPASHCRLGPLVVDAGGFNRTVTIGPAPCEDGPRHVALTTVDTESIQGHCPYWVRVVQVDQAIAWSSPVYVMRT